MSRAPSHAAGFSAVELLVTLFIAAAFLLAGYQLYAAIVRDSGDARQRTRASNIAYDYLRRYAASAPAICSPSTPVNNTSLSPIPDGLGMAVVTVQISCPNSGLTRLKKIQTTVRYTASGEEVQHAIYVTS